MRIPTPGIAAFWVAVSLDVVLLLALAAVGINPRTTRESRQPAAAVARVADPKAEPRVTARVIPRLHEVWLRVVDAEGAKPIGRARVVIDNGNLGSDLGEDSDAVTWPDGLAIVRHRFFAWEEREGRLWSSRMVFQGPWVDVSAEGYQTRKVPLADLIVPDAPPPGPSHELVIALRRGRTPSLALAELAGDFIFGNGHIYEHLEIDPAGHYHYQWGGDMRTDEPHDQDRYESRGQCSIVDGVLRLVPDGPFSSDLRKSMGNDFVPVHWGTRRYLVPEKERLTFCSEVNQGIRPQFMRSGPFSLDVAMSQARPKGLPEVPPAWSALLLEKPVTATIIEPISDGMAVLSGGEKDGLKAGMLLLRESNRFAGPVRVLFTEPDRCVIAMDRPDIRPMPEGAGQEEFMKAFGPQPFEVGEKISSRSPDAGRDL